MKTNTHFFILSRPFLLRMRNVSDESCKKNQNTRFVFGNVFFEKCVFSEKMWKNFAERHRSRMTIGSCALHAGYLIYKHTNSGCVILIAFPRQQYLHERAAMLPYTYIVCLVLFDFIFNLYTYTEVLVTIFL